jgi:predicted TIM-barrel fold metal-dependent hydrolase
LTLANPPIELLAEPAVAVELAQMANDEMAELVQKYPDRFVGAVASLPLNDVDASLREADRAINDLHLKGVQIFTRIAGKPVDSPEFVPLYEKLAQYDLPIWIHPFYEMGPGPGAKDHPVPDKPDPAVAMDRAGFQLIYPSATAMTRLVYSHIFDKYPKIKFITHHCGCTVPYLADRLQMIYDMAAKRQGIQHGLSKPILDYYRMFYADTALHGNVPAMMCGYHFFGADHILFGTDMPFDAELCAWSIRKTVESIEQMNIADSERVAIFEKNARELLRLTV